MRRTSSSSSSDSTASSPRYSRARSSSVPTSLKSSKKTNTKECLKLLLVGDHQVGKSAIAVKLLTRRFIGTYQNDKDMLYESSQIVTNSDDSNKPLKLEVLDTTSTNVSDDDGSSPAIDHLYWSSAIVIVYDVTSSRSFSYAADLLKDIKREKPNHICLLLGNKTDLSHEREVTNSSAADLGNTYANCLSAEISAASSDHTEISATFQPLFTLCKTVVPKPAVKRRRSIVDMAKAFSTLLRSGSTKHSETKAAS
ncbi:ras-related and estrogen-regulated growth inhibitor-like [Watersipora subatra]|uniref:ras-related and estrogen-regulated growth inhibitor-like n=1 Tax=Watersipora subatra TaxID=2589382 RepID=UPI00355B4696